MRQGFEFLSFLHVVAVMIFHAQDAFIDALSVSNGVRISLKDQRIITHEGSTIQMTATIISKRNESISSWHWFRNERMIPSNKRFESQVISNYTRANESYIIITMDVKNVKLIDTGNWTIKVMSANNHTVFETAFVTVFSRPVLKAQRSTLVIKEGSPIFLVCFWTNNSHETNFPVINFNSSSGSQLGDWILTATTNNFYSVFMKLKSEVSDQGSYQCYSNEKTDVYTSQSRRIEVYIYTADDIVCQSNVDQYGINWPDTFGNTILNESCPSGLNGNSSRFCTSSGKWNSTDVSYCYDYNLDAISEKLDDIDAELVDGTADDSAVSEVIKDTLTETEVVTRRTNNPGDLNRTVNILERVVRLTNYSGSMVNNFKRSFFVTLDNLLSSRNEDAWTQLSERPDLSSAELVMSLVDRFSVYVRQGRRNSNITDRFNGSNFEVKHDLLNSIQDITFPEETSEESFLMLPQQNANITGNSYTAVIYRGIANILPTKLSNTSKANMTMKAPVVNTPILSFTLNTVPDILSPPLTLIFSPMNKTGDLSSSVCVFWNFSSRNGLGGWDTDGCNLIQSTSDRITCQCNHLTNFAVLMSLDTDVADAEFLSTISLIGSCISVICASLTVIMHTLVWRYLKSEVVILLMNLCVALAISYLLFIVGTYASVNEIACTVITFFLHSMLLVMFSMMQCIGIYYFRNIVIASIWLRFANRFSRRSNIPLFLGFGWGIPFAISLTTLGIFFHQTYHLSNHCWLSVDSGSIYFFVVPVCLVIFINFIIILALLKVSLSRMKGYAKQTSQNPETISFSAKARMALKNFGVLVPVLGVTWIFGVLSINENTEVFQYLFTISSSLQGLLIFIIHVPLNKKLRDAYKKKFRFLETSSSSHKSTGSSNLTAEQKISTTVQMSKISDKPKKHEDVAGDGMVRISKIVNDWTT